MLLRVLNTFTLQSLYLDSICLSLSAGKESACNAGDPSLIPGWGRSAGEGMGYPLQHSWASLVAQLVKNPPTMQETLVQFLGQKIPWRRDRLLTPAFWPGEFQGLYSLWSCRVRHDWATFTHKIIHFSKRKQIWFIFFMGGSVIAGSRPVLGIY